MFERKKNLLKSYFKKIISNYCLEDLHQITKYKFSELIELPLVISDRFWNIIISKCENKNELKVEEYSKEIEILPKNLVVNNLIDFYTYIINRKSEFLFEFLDIDNKGVLIKNDVKYLLRNIFVHQNQSINNFQEEINSEIKKSFGNGKILLKNEYNEKFCDSLKLFLFDFFNKIKLFKNFEFINYNCQITFHEGQYENNYIDNFSNIIIYLGINEEIHEFTNYFSNKVNDESDTNLTEEESDFSYNNEYNNLANVNPESKQRKMTYSFNQDKIQKENELYNDMKNNCFKRRNTKKESFQIEKPDQYHLTSNEDEKNIKKYNEHEFSCFTKNFFCWIKQFYYLYKFFIYNGYIFYFKLNPKKYLFTFDGIIIISNTHMKSNIITVEGSNPTLYKSSIVSHICFENLSTDIFSYDIKDMEDFSNELKKYSKYKKFKNNYKIVKKIGEGHFGDVYMVENILKENKIFAAKIIDKDNILEDNKNISMEIWEKNIFDYIKYVPNKNIVKSIEYFENSENIYFIFEYLPDGELNSFDSNIIKEIYNGLLYLKKNGIIHRDIKAKNIIMKDGHPFIIDFGLSKIQSKNSLSYESYGSFTYIAPEIFENYGYNHKCDVWSFGIMLHCLKYGEVPFDSEDDDKEKIVKKILEQKYEKKNDSIYDTLIELCLEKRASDRKKINELFNLIKYLS